MNDKYLALLKEEIDTNLVTYAAWIDTGNDEAVAAELNRVDSKITVTRGVTPVASVNAILDAGEVKALEQRLFDMLTELFKPTEIDLSVANVQNTLNVIFETSPVTLAALAAFYTREGSRAEQLLGVGVGVSHSDIAAIYVLERIAKQVEKEATDAPALAVAARSAAELAVSQGDADAAKKVKEAERLESELQFRDDEAAKYRTEADALAAKLAAAATAEVVAEGAIK